jgi:hypothetical protein
MLMKTRLGETLLKATKLNDVQAWLDSVTPELQEKYVEDWIRGDQLFKRGVDETGETLGTYSYTTQIMSGGRKKAGTHYTFFDSGQFYRSIFTRLTANLLRVDGDFEKMKDKNWWNENNLDENKILGLTDENNEKFVQILAENYRKYTRRILGVD